MTKPRLTIVIPAFREAHIIEQTLRTVAAFLHAQQLHATTEVIVVAANGNDATAAIARKHASLFTLHKVLTPDSPVGKGRDVRIGFEAATGTYQLFMDADLATPLEHIIPMLERLEQGDNMVIGIRNLGTIHHGLRTFISTFGNWLTKIVLGLAITDTQCGFKGFDAQSAKLIFDRQTIQGWGFDMELLMIARMHKLRIGQLAIPDWHDPREEGELTHEKRVGLGAAISTFRELLVIKWRAVTGKYS